MRRERRTILRNHTIEVYGTTLGLARERHVKLAVKRLHAKEVINDDGVDRKNMPKFYTRPIKWLG